MSFNYIEEPSQQADNFPIGEDWWNRSKESRKHPELYSSGHGTVDVPWSLDNDECKHSAATVGGEEGGEQTSSARNHKKMEKLLNNEKQQQQSSDHMGAFGHTMKKHKYTVRSIHRDLDNI